MRSDSANKNHAKDRLTIAPEAGTERLRSVINKNITEREVIETARKVFENGWDLIKLYFMFGLPTEKEEDLRGIAELVRKIREEGRKAGVRPRLNVGLSAFVPKPHTPFQWETMLTEKEIEERLSFLKRLLAQPGVQVKWSPPFMSLLEGAFARGDDILADVLIEAEAMGAGFDAWGDSLRVDIWRDAFSKVGISIEEVACRPRELNEPLPWDNIMTGVEKYWLKRERALAFQCERSYGCENSPCAQPCGACDGEAMADFKRDNIGIPHNIGQEELARESFIRYRIIYSKTGIARFVGHLDTIRLFQRSLRRSGIKLQYTEGFHPKPKMSFGEALPVGIESLCETFDIWVHESQSVDEIYRRLKESLTEGFEIKEVKGIDNGAPSSEGSVKGVVFRFENLGEEVFAEISARIGRFLKEEKFVVEMKSKKGVRGIDLKEAVKSIRITDDGALELTLCKTTSGAKIRPNEAYEKLFGTLPESARIIKTAVLTS
jgi:radical SAM-linked protein